MTAVWDAVERRSGTDRRAPVEPRRWTLRYESRPFTLNGERKLTPRQRAELVAEWRQSFGWLARAAGMPRPVLVRVSITAVPHLRSAAGMQDPGGCFPAAKAAIDGLVDVGVLRGDDGRYVDELRLRRPVIDAVHGDALVLIVEEVPVP